MKIVIDEDELYPDYTLLEYQPDGPKTVDVPDDLVARYNAAQAEYMRLRAEISAIVIRSCPRTISGVLSFGDGPGL